MQIVYGLVDPRNRYVVYVGRTNDLRRRLLEHTRGHSPLPKVNAFVDELAAVHLVPSHVIFYVTSTARIAATLENSVITALQDAGANLLNTLPEGRKSGRRLTEAQRKMLIRYYVINNEWPAPLNSDMRRYYEKTYFEPTGKRHGRYLAWRREWGMPPPQ